MKKIYLKIYSENYNNSYFFIFPYLDKILNMKEIKVVLTVTIFTLKTHLNLIYLIKSNCLCYPVVALKWGIQFE